MMRRKKLYYPEYQIQKDKFTNGGELMDSSGNEYIGYYHTYVTGEIFSQSQYDSVKSIKLYPLRKDIQSTYKKLKVKNNSYLGFLKSDLNMIKYSQPAYQLSKPSEDDFLAGFYFRYFAVKRNEPTKILEISKNQFSSYGRVAGINDKLYIVDSIRWNVTGPEFDIKTESGSIVSYGVVSSNLRTLDQLSRKYPYIKTIFSNPEQFTAYDKGFTPNKL
jgi:hypothetical protein